MDNGNTPINTLQDIKQMMERSSRFISLSGWSGIAARLAGVRGQLVSKLCSFKTFSQHATASEGD